MIKQLPHQTSFQMRIVSTVARLLIFCQFFKSILSVLSKSVFSKDFRATKPTLLVTKTVCFYCMQVSTVQKQQPRKCAAFFLSFLHNTLASGFVLEQKSKKKSFLGDLLCTFLICLRQQPIKKENALQLLYFECIFFSNFDV